MNKSDYEKALDRIKEIPQVYLGQEVKTPVGKGIVVALMMDYNGLYILPELSKVTVWFSTSGAKGGWVNTTFKLSELKINNRKDKLKKIEEKIKEYDNKTNAR